LGRIGLGQIGLGTIDLYPFEHGLTLRGDNKDQNPTLTKK